VTWDAVVLEKTTSMPQPMKGQISHLETKSTLRGAFLVSLVASHTVVLEKK
jgi:hypothetical protein